MRIEDDVALGIEAGLAPRQADAADGDEVTAPPSWWFNLTCPACGHTFRRGDRVRVNRAARHVVHLEPGLGCAGGSAAQVAPETASFAAGLLAAWPAGARVVELAEDDWRLPRRGSALAGQRCLHCAHTFRPGEQVVICPCHPDSPACGAAIHRDPARGLPCWERWRPDGTVPVCPVAKARNTEG